MYYFLIAALIGLVDQVTKYWVLTNFQLYESREIIPGFFNLVYVTNTGAAFSMLADIDSPWRHCFFLTVGIVALIGLTIAYYRFRQDHQLYGVALSLIAGGAAGNLVDRVRLGSVVDFLDVYLGSYHWPAFNVADSAICIGAGLFVIINLVDARKKDNRR